MTPNVEQGPLVLHSNILTIETDDNRKFEEFNSLLQQSITSISVKS